MATVSDAGPAPTKAMRLPFFLRRRPGQQAGNVVAVIGGDALQAADGDGLLLVEARAPAGRFARPVAHSAEDAREDIGFPVHHIGVGEPPLGDQSDVFGDRRVGGTGPLTINDTMKVVGLRRVGSFHYLISNESQFECGTHNKNE